MVRLGTFASKTELRKPEKRGSGLSSVERGAQPFRPARPVAGLRRIFRAITTACSDGFRRERAESLKKFVNNPGKRCSDGERRDSRRTFGTEGTTDVLPTASNAEPAAHGGVCSDNRRRSVGSCPASAGLRRQCFHRLRRQGTSLRQALGRKQGHDQCRGRRRR